MLPNLPQFHLCLNLYLPNNCLSSCTPAKEHPLDERQRKAERQSTTMGEDDMGPN